MASIWVTGFLPDTWSDVGELVDAFVEEGVGLYRWEEWSHEDGRRSRATHLVPSVGGPSLEEVQSTVIGRAQIAGFRLARIDEQGARTVLAQGDRALSLAGAPLPPRLILSVDDRVAQRGAAQYPAIAEIFRLCASAGAARFAKLHRFAELDLEAQDRFYPPTTEMSASGAYDPSALCAALSGAGFVEDGDVWIREGDVLRAEVKLGDGVVSSVVAPR